MSRTSGWGGTTRTAHLQLEKRSSELVPLRGDSDKRLAGGRQLGWQVESLAAKASGFTVRKLRCLCLCPPYRHHNCRFFRRQRVDWWRRIPANQAS